MQSDTMIKIPSPKATKRLSNNLTCFILCLVIFSISHFTYFNNYDYPSRLFWDENYHIASAEKYLDGVMFMEPHPPLGKLFIALGEHLWSPNKHIDTTSFLETDYIENKDFPENYSFTGVRFFPALFGSLGAILFFLILYEISKNYLTAFLFSSLYLFENALILQSRGAMLDSTQLFFSLLCILYFLKLFNQEKLEKYNYFVLGILAGLAISVKVNSVILTLFFPILFHFKSWSKKDSWKNLLSRATDFSLKAAVFSFGIILIFCSVFYVHFAIGTRVVSERTYDTTDNYRKILSNGKMSILKNFPILIRDSLKYSNDYQADVPVYDECKPVENGSLPLTWPFGNKSINYRWEKSGPMVRYLYLQGNPVIWASGLLGIILSLTLLAAVSIFKLPVKNRRLLSLIATFTLLYLAYMAAMYNIRRVMYLYHYLIPLLFSLFLFYTVFHYIFEEKIRNKDKNLLRGMLVFVAIIILVYLFFAPLTYYLPLTNWEFHLREWFEFWKLKPV